MTTSSCQLRKPRQNDNKPASRATAYSATLCRPLARAYLIPSHLPRARGLALGYMLLPTAWADARLRGLTPACVG
jgi:hypothetical protein